MEHTNSNSCPACAATNASTYLSVKDHFLTKEEFNLMLCGSCELLFTAPRPAIEKIGDYYKSEDYVSHSSTKKGIVNRIYGVVRKRTLKQKVSLLSSLIDGKELLDIGAGTGHFLAEAQNAGYSVTGLEPDPDARAVAKSENNVELKELDVLHELQGDSVNAITMWHVLEHVYNLNQDLEKIVSLIREKGVLVIAVPNYTSFDASYYKEFWAAYDVPRHLYHFSPASIIPLVEKYGMKFEKMMPMKFDSYYVSMLSEKYKGGSLLNALRIGWLSNMRSKGGKCSSQIYIFRK